MVETKKAALGFGFIPAESQHHFLVTIPPVSKDDKVYISEHLEWDESEARRELHFSLGSHDSKMRVLLSRAKWDALAEEVRVEFNSRLRDQGIQTGQWKTGQIPVSRLLGKELVLLAWAVEDADPSLIPTAIRNWRGLAPEERWWLFTMTNAATGHAVSGRNRGWRKAVRYALTENPISGSEGSISEHRRQSGLLAGSKQLSLLD
ncbi:MAG: DUF3780 domain-containing protein [Ardenticatenaceae bacterium]|nr:DUF3780 domain-containing protein [Ardenticatenaceae bacterium]